MPAPLADGRKYLRGVILPPSPSEGSPAKKRTDSLPGSWQRRSGRSPGSGIIRGRAAFPSTTRDSGPSCSSRPPSQLRGSAGLTPASLLREHGSPPDPYSRPNRYVGRLFRTRARPKSRDRFAWRRVASAASRLKSSRESHVGSGDRAGCPRRVRRSWQPLRPSLVDGPRAARSNRASSRAARSIPPRPELAHPSRRVDARHGSPVA